MKPLPYLGGEGAWRGADCRHAANGGRRRFGATDAEGWRVVRLIVVLAGVGRAR